MTPLPPSSILKGLCPPAQGCEERATLGSRRTHAINPNGVVPSFATPPRHNPVGVAEFFSGRTQGSSFLATLGFGAESRWDSEFYICSAITNRFAPTWRSALRSGSIGSLFFIFAFGLAAALSAGQPAGEEGRGRFRAVDIYLDSKSAPLAAYQLEFAATNGAVKIVGIEGGEHPAFREAPFYDPKAIQQERVIIAAFSTEPAAKLPTGKTRVATIHIQITGPGEPAFELKLQTAADSQGNKIAVEASFEERKDK